MNKTTAILVAVISLLCCFGGFIVGRNSKECPTVAASKDSANVYRARVDSLSELLAFALADAKDAHASHVTEINQRPTPTIDEYFVHSPNADSALAKWRGIILQRPRQYSYRTDGAGHVLLVDSVR
jgi:hypothetical protein